MGLDTFLFAVRKPTNEEVGWMTKRDLTEIKQTEKYLTFSHDRVQKNPQLYNDMKPYWTLITTTETQFDWMKCLADHGIDCDDDVAFTGRTGDTINYGFASGAEFTMTMDEYNTYLMQDIVDVYVVAKDDVARLRNNWDTIETISDLRAQRLITKYINDGTYEKLKDASTYGICNCGYYIMDDDEKEAIRSDVEDVTDTDIDNKTIALCAWW